MRRLPLVIAILSLLMTGAAVAAAGSGPLPPGVQAVRSSVARFHSAEQAAAAGYFAASPCEATPAGAMGVHFINPALFGPGIDPLTPEILLYLPTADGSLKLVGVEYFAVDADQDLATDDDRPFLFGQGFDGPMEGHAPGMPRHYDLHVWVAEGNPSGLFAPWNPAISCP